jgi:hypothetical protein
MTHLKTIARVCLLAAFIFAAQGCNMPELVATAPPASQNTAAPTAQASADQLPAPETLISFRVVAPPNTPPDTLIYLSLLDEVTGLALNAQVYPMEPGAPIPGNESSPVYVITLPFRIGSLIKYRYERSVGPIRVAEHLSDGSAVRYRIYHVVGQGFVDDVISRWTDTAYMLPSGRIAGSASDAVTGQPIANLLIAAGGAQTFTASDGSFLLEGLPPGVHNLTAYAIDGAYQTFQQGARVAAESTTPAPIQLQPAKFSNVVFVVRVPEGTLPVIPVRLAGNTYTLGNTFANLALGASALPANMPVMKPLPDGRYTLTVSLPVGADVRYKYTLGDGFWNAERNLDGSLRLRQLIVPEQTLLVEDTVETWQDGAKSSLTFDVRAPADTPPQDFISIQFNPLIGWTEPLPMWNLGGGRWAYVLYSPLELPAELRYRYCRNGQCGFADDAQTPGVDHPGRVAQLSDRPQTITDQITAWANWSSSADASLPTVETAPKSGAFAAGVALSPRYHPAYRSLFPAALDDIQKINTNLVVISPTWSYGRAAPGNNPPILLRNPERDASWFDLTDMLQQVKGRGLNTALYPDVNFAIRWDQWWASAPREAPGWWPVWFEQYRAFVMHHTDLAAASGAEAIILGGDWLTPALPSGVLPDGQPSGAPADAETRWRSLLAEVRSRYGGKLFWSISSDRIETPPSFLDAFDLIYLTLTIPPGESFESMLGRDLESWLDSVVWPTQLISGTPVLLALDIPSNPTLQMQVDLYQTALSAATQRDWIGGVIAAGYDPAAALRDASSSVHGKPAGELLGLWFAQLLGK